MVTSLILVGIWLSLWNFMESEHCTPWNAHWNVRHCLIEHNWLIHDTTWIHYQIDQEWRKSLSTQERDQWLIVAWIYLMAELPTLNFVSRNELKLAPIIWRSSTQLAWLEMDPKYEWEMHSKRFVGASGIEEVSNEFARLEMDPKYNWEVHSKKFVR